MTPSNEEWISFLQDKSIPFEKFGSFLPEQEKMFEIVYKYLHEPEKPILCISSPPASGKTHAICLLACYFSNMGKKTAIIVPNNYLRKEFTLANEEVKDDMSNIDIITLFEYLRTDLKYDYVLIDEAHNIKSYLELDSNVVINFELNEKDESYTDLLNRFLPPSKPFITQQISHSSAKDIIDNLSDDRKHRQRIEPVSSDPTAWLTFIYIWGNREIIHLKFVHSEDSFKFKLPNESMFMFSATPLSDIELENYCGIEPSSAVRAEPIKSLSTWRAKQRLYLSIVEEFNQHEKIEFLKSILIELNTRILVLFNNFTNCIYVYNELKNYVDNICIIPRDASGRMDVYNDFRDTENGILFTSSTVFWEGITIQGLELVIIFELPVPRSNILDLMYGRNSDYRSDVLRRLEQGLGRIGRKMGESGIGLTLFDISTFIYDLPEIASESKLLLIRSWDTMLILHKLIMGKELTIEMFYE